MGLRLGIKASSSSNSEYEAKALPGPLFLKYEGVETSAVGDPTHIDSTLTMEVWAPSPNS